MDPHPTTYSFMQESQLEIESPHMDPAVVAVSSFAPPPPQLQSQSDANHVFNPEQVNETMGVIQPGVRDLNLNHTMNTHNNGEAEEDWEEKMPASTFNNNSSVNGNMKEDDGRNMTTKSLNLKKLIKFKK